MAKISKEEYELTKSLDGYWKWIARDEDGGLYKFHGKPKKVNRFLWNDRKETWLGMNRDRFQFIQWEDENPFSIAELIEEYESEETEVLTEEQAYNKIAESFPATAKEIESVLEKYYSGVVIGFSEELRESVTRAFDAETISKKIEALTGMTVEQIEEAARNGGIVPKQELPVIPNFVADWISEHHEEFDLYPALRRLEEGSTRDYDAYKWYRANTLKFVAAYLTGIYEVEEEQVMEWLDNNDFYDHRTAETVLENAVDKGELGYYGTKYSVVKKEPETVADVVTTFWKSYERLKEVMSMELEELEE